MPQPEGFGNSQPNELCLAERSLIGAVTEQLLFRSIIESGKHARHRIQHPLRQRPRQGSDRH